LSIAEVSLSIIEVSMAKSSDLIQGTLDLLILKTLARGPVHGWGIAKRIEQLSDDVLSVGQGSLYPALHRLEQQGWISAEWRDSDLGRSAKFYSLTRDGKKQLENELKTWSRLSSAVALVIQRA
jgi:PadR family transcriptional regulator, regulatory protein PadR